MIQHIWTIPCRLSLIAQGSNNVTLVEILEEITIPEFPVEPGQAHGLVPAVFDVVSLWNREHPDRPESGFGRISLLSPDGAELLHNEFPVDLTQGARARWIGRFVGIPMIPAGQSVLRVERRAIAEDAWQEVGRLPILINRMQPQNPPENNANGPA